VLAMVTVTAMEENVEFCAAVGPATRTAGILIQLVKGLAVKVSQPSGCSGSYTGLIGFNHRWLKVPKVDEVPRNGPSCLCEIFCSSMAKRSGITQDVHFGPTK